MAFPVHPQLAKLVKRAAGPLLLYADSIHRRPLTDPLPLSNAPDLFDDL